MGMSGKLLRPAGRFTPKSVAGLESWWDASDAGTVTLNGTTVQSWANKSTGPALSQGTAAAQPTYTTSGVNGLNVLSFDGGDVLSASAAYSTQLATIFLVVRENSAVNFAGFFALTPASGNDNGNSNAILIESATTDNVVAVQRGTTHQAVFSGAGVLPLSVVTVRGLSNALLLRTDGTVRQNNTSNNFSGTSAGILLGGRYQAGAISASFRANITVCEILHYTVGLSDSDVSRVERYLGRKWGVTVA